MDIQTDRHTGPNYRKASLLTTGEFSPTSKVIYLQLEIQYVTSSGHIHSCDSAAATFIYTLYIPYIS